MLKAEDLRIGNILIELGDGEQHPEESIIVVNEITKKEFRTYVNGSPIDFFQPIPLTEEKLLSFGFEKSNAIKTESVCYRKKDFALTKIGKKWHVHRFVCVNTGKDGMAFLLVSIENVHELQNTYSCLMKGEELN